MIVVRICFATCTAGLNCWHLNTRLRHWTLDSRVTSPGREKSLMTETTPEDKTRQKIRIERKFRYQRPLLWIKASETTWVNALAWQLTGQAINQLFWLRRSFESTARRYSVTLRHTTFITKIAICHSLFVIQILYLLLQLCWLIVIIVVIIKQINVCLSK